jgi:preprotein translocase subunit SecA
MDDNIDELLGYLLTLFEVRKYKSMCDSWIGFGSLCNSKRSIDIIAYSNQKWTYNEDLEKKSFSLLEGKNKGTEILFDQKIGRNQKCKCGSGLKYKNCCGIKTK